ncbi:hypothetical protein GCM10009854_00250 [Saccharopolyspora halophila]|uniref:Uncharacterized protein n=1 Tax=Saccharopolyspora halophila TaxID=405551 RepID=A0ABP5SEJ8_9PSEU
MLPTADGIDHPVANRPGVIQTADVEGGQSHRLRHPGADQHPQGPDAAVLARVQPDRPAGRQTAAAAQHGRSAVPADDQGFALRTMDVLQNRSFLDHVGRNAEDVAGHAAVAAQPVRRQLFGHLHHNSLLASLPGAALGADVHPGDPGQVQELVLDRALDRADHRPIAQLADARFRGHPPHSTLSVMR